jgi:Ca-activated chloride channel homolog
MRTLPHGRRYSPVFLTLIFLIGLLAPEFAFNSAWQDPPSPLSTVALHSTVSEVRLVFFATDEHNRRVLELQESDFAVVDSENIVRKFRSFTRSASTKLDVIVLVDSSGSVLSHFKEEMENVTQLISRSPWSSDDNLSVMEFGGLQMQTLCSTTCRASFRPADVIPGGGATPLLDAVETATDMLSRRLQPEVWPVIILFSDGEDNFSKSSLRDVLKKLLAAGIQIYAVDVSNPHRLADINPSLQKLAADSGGRCVLLREGPGKIFGDVIDDLHSARVVTYALPRSPSAFHSIRILPTHNLNLQFRCRRGYYHPVEGQNYEDNP